MKLSMRTWFLPVACALALPGLLAAQNQDEQEGGIPAPPPPDQTMDQSTSDETPGQAQAPGQDEDASFQTFYDALSSQGTWIQSSDYGYVWQPDVDDPDWAPYTDGDWVYSDDDWTWASNEPWGWATYHYGRWVNLTGHGWCWVPGYTWAPAWVSWRYGNGYCGWAPLPPDSFYGIDYFDGDTDISLGFHIGGDCDFFFGIGPGCYSFVPVRCLGYRNYHGYYAPRADNFAIINHTTNVTNIIVSRNGAPGGSAFGHVSVGGPSLAQVNAVTETPVERVSLVASNRLDGGAVSNHSLALFAPRVDPGTRTTSRPGRVTETIERAAINRGTDVTQPLAVNEQLSPSAPTQEQVRQAREAQLQAPAGAKVVTAHTVIQPVFHGPLNSLRTLPGTGTAEDASPGVVAPQPAVPRRQGGPVVYSQQGQVDQTQPEAHAYMSPNHSPTQPETVHPSPEPSTQRAYAPSHDTSSNGASPQPGNDYRSGGQAGGASGGYHNGGGSGGNSGGGGNHGGNGPWPPPGH
jgi:hypothetical protein